MDEAHRTRGISTRVTEDDYQRLQSLAGTTPISEWLRGVALAQLSRVPVEEAMLGELLAVRAVVLTMMGRVATPAEVVALVERADKDKREKAQRALRGV